MESAGDALKSWRKLLKAAGEIGSASCRCYGLRGLRGVGHTQLRFIVNRRLPLKKRHVRKWGLCR